MRVRWLGFVITAFVFLILLLSYSLSILNSHLSIFSLKNNSTLKNSIDIQIIPYLGFNWTLFFVGLSLIILSSLLKIGSSIESENKLTI